MVAAAPNCTPETKQVFDQVEKELEKVKELIMRCCDMNRMRAFFKSKSMQKEFESWRGRLATVMSWLLLANLAESSQVKEQMSSVFQAMKEGQGSMDQVVDSIRSLQASVQAEMRRKHTEKEAKLESQYNASVPHIDFLKGLRDKMGPEYCDDLAWNTTSARFTAEDKEKAIAAMRALWGFWRHTTKLYLGRHLLHPGDDPARPNGFFSGNWLGRGREYRLLVEPVDIANWYSQKKFEKYGHYMDGIETFDDEFKVDNNKRPGRYLLLQQLEEKAKGRANVESSLDKAREYKRVVEAGARAGAGAVPV
ncbi:hypothetical protein WJX72_010260 [[Myrmecia] bisecta]|uniref:EDS1 EP domain-containing protein n=1 Tax=[Myrmecia] bisecta TaxID=41462 RepID=A0AAW1PEC7_9CHLO